MLSFYPSKDARETHIDGPERLLNIYGSVEEIIYHPLRSLSSPSRVSQAGCSHSQVSHSSGLNLATSQRFMILLWLAFDSHRTKAEALPLLILPVCLARPSAAAL